MFPPGFKDLMSRMVLVNTDLVQRTDGTTTTWTAGASWSRSPSPGTAAWSTAAG